MKEFVEWLKDWWPVITTILLPFVVAAIAKIEWSGTAKMWLATGLSVVVGVGAAFTADIPITPENMVIIVLAVRGGVEVSYSLFQRAGITSSWLDWLLKIGSDAVPAGGYIEAGGYLEA